MTSCATPVPAKRSTRTTWSAWYGVFHCRQTPGFFMLTELPQRLAGASRASQEPSIQRAVAERQSPTQR
jgi:hypothetical protein